MTIYKNDPNYETSYTSKKHTFITDGNVKIRRDNKKHKITQFRNYYKVNSK